MSSLVPFPRLFLVYKVLKLANDAFECDNSFYFTTYGVTGVMCISQLTEISIPQTVPSNTIWPQFRIGMTVESRDDRMSEIGGDATELASACHADEGFDPFLYSFEV